MTPANEPQAQLIRQKAAQAQQPYQEMEPKGLRCSQLQFFEFCVVK
jgi:hypothetical protein